MSSDTDKKSSKSIVKAAKSVAAGNGNSNSRSDTKQIEKLTERLMSGLPKITSEAKHLPSKDVDSHERGKADKVLQSIFRDGQYPYAERMSGKEYDNLARELQIELLKMQSWVRETGERIIILFEGRDAAGKGGTIKRFMEHMNPRGARVVALDKPSDRERGQWYFQRYINVFPTRGEIVMFDRSWYNRAGVERVMGYCSQAEYMEFLRQTPQLETLIVQTGIRLFKLWFSVSRAEQLRRFNQRKDDPLRRWKLSPVDTASLGLWDEYTQAKTEMFLHTDTKDAPWIVIKSDDKNRARINTMKYILHSLPYHYKDEKVVSAADPLIVGRAALVYEQDERPLRGA